MESRQKKMVWCDILSLATVATDKNICHPVFGTLLANIYGVCRNSDNNNIN